MVATVFWTLRALSRTWMGKRKPAHADLVNAQFAVVALALLVVQLRGGDFPAAPAPPRRFGQFEAWEQTSSFAEIGKEFLTKSV